MKMGGKNIGQLPLEKLFPKTTEFRATLIIKLFLSLNFRYLLYECLVKDSSSQYSPGGDAYLPDLGALNHPEDVL